MVYASFAEGLTALMVEHGVGVRALARRVPCSPGYLSRLRSGHERPSPGMARRLDELLGAGGELAATASAPRSPLSLAGVNGHIVTPDDEARLLAVLRAPSRVDRATVDALAAVLAAQRRLEDAVGSTPLLKPVAAQLDAITRLVRDARGAIRPAVVHVAGQWAQFYGWLRANAGDVDGGRAWLDHALEWSVETSDVNLISEVLSFKGHVAWMSGEVGPMIGLSEAALRGAGLYPGQYAISAAQEARGLAMLGEAYEAERRLDEADEFAAAARERVEEAPPWLYYHSPGFFALQRGLAYRYLGDHDTAYVGRAIDTLTAGLTELPGDMRASEWAGEFVYHLACAYRQAGEREQAASLAGDLRALADKTGSSRLAAQAAAVG